MNRIYIGFDSREPDAYLVAESSLRRRAKSPVSVTPLNGHRLAESGLLRRPMDTRGNRFDFLSGAPCSTEFAISRFLVPILAQTGWALFVDSDVVFLGDVGELFALADPDYAVMVVKHAPYGGGQKMGGQAQLAYPRKGWSSVVLWNCDHPANRRLSLVDVQERRGFDLHGFYWLADYEIGELPESWNWLVNVVPPPDYARLAHFTEGGPFLSSWNGAPYDAIWTEAYREATEREGVAA